MEIADPEGTQPAESETAAVEPMPEVEAVFEEIEVDAPLVGIIMGSKNDKSKMQPAGAALQERGIRYEVRVMSAHRDPEKVREYCHAARMRGLRVLIAGAGMSAALPGVAGPTPTSRSSAFRCRARRSAASMRSSRRSRCRRESRSD